MIDIKTVKHAFTHGGIFHADDVFSTALLLILNPEIEVTRGNEVPKDFDGLVFDIGRGEFDHHQQDKRIRENGVPYAAFGLLWETYGTLILDEADAVKFDENFIQPLDNADNTGDSHVLSMCVGDWNPNWDEETDRYAAFMGAVDMAKTILEKRFASILAKRKAYSLVRALVEKNEGPILLLEEVMPWKEAVKESDIVYVIFKSLRGGYMVQAVASDEDKHVLKKEFPKEWRGETADVLREKTGIESFGFCHMSGFLCAVDTLEDAWKAAKMSLEMEA